MLARMPRVDGLRFGREALQKGSVVRGAVSDGDYGDTGRGMPVTRL